MVEPPHLIVSCRGSKGAIGPIRMLGGLQPHRDLMGPMVSALYIVVVFASISLFESVQIQLPWSKDV